MCGFVCAFLPPTCTVAHLGSACEGARGEERGREVKKNGVSYLRGTRIAALPSCLPWTPDLRPRPTRPFCFLLFVFRYEVNPDYVQQLEAAGLEFVGRDTTGAPDWNTGTRFRHGRQLLTRVSFRHGCQIRACVPYSGTGTVIRIWHQIRSRRWVQTWPPDVEPTGFACLIRHSK